LIEIKKLEKRFGKYEVLKGISFNIEHGKITAIVGPNGSGKTTIIKSILGLVKPDDGEILVDGKSILNEYVYRNRVGYMPQQASFPENLTVKEVVKMICDIRNTKIEIDPVLINKFNLSGEMNKQIKNLSGGNKQKVSAVISLMFNPSILILDEPTAGLDPIASSNLKEIVLAEKNNGKAVVLTSHIISEIEELADHIIFLLDGKICFDGSIITLLANKGESKLEKAISQMMTEASKWN